MTPLESMLRGSLWSATLRPDELDLVLEHAFDRWVPVGGYAVRRGEPADCWIGVIDGLVKMSVSQPDGRESTFTGVTRGGWAGEGTLLKTGPWRYDGVAVRDTHLACLPRHVFEHLVATSLGFNRFLLLSGVVMSLTAHAQSIKPGLWEMNQKMGGNAEMDQAMAQMQKQMAGMSAAQRKQMEDMLAKQGMSMPTAGAGGGMALKVCVTPEMAAKLATYGADARYMLRPL